MMHPDNTPENSSRAGHNWDNGYRIRTSQLEANKSTGRHATKQADTTIYHADDCKCVYRCLSQRYVGTPSSTSTEMLQMLHQVAIPLPITAPALTHQLSPCNAGCTFPCLPARVQSSPVRHSLAQLHSSLSYWHRLSDYRFANDIQKTL